MFSDQSSVFSIRVRTNKPKTKNEYYRQFNARFIKACTLLKESHDVFIQFPSNSYRVVYLVICTVNAILFVSTILLNGSSVVAILKCTQLKTKVCFFLVLVQSSFDLAVGLLALPFFTVVLATELLGTVNCIVTLVAYKVMILPSSFSIFTLTALTFERYMGLIYHFRTKL